MANRSSDSRLYQNSNRLSAHCCTEMSEPSPLNPTETERDPERVRAMFGRVARRYDLANHLLSGGLDFWWRRRASDIIREWRPRRVLDLATGSGDLALAIARKVPEAEITGADFCAEMLAVARRKGLTNTVVADALQLPFPAGSFDVVTVAFGLRNMADWPAALGEMRRVLRAWRTSSGARFFVAAGLAATALPLLSAPFPALHRRRRDGRTGRLPIFGRVD